MARDDGRPLLLVGIESSAVAHVDLFVSNVAQERVFAPIAFWLASPGVRAAGR